MDNEPIVLALSATEVAEAVWRYAAARDKLSAEVLSGRVTAVSFSAGGRTLTEYPVVAVAFLPGRGA